MKPTPFLFISILLLLCFQTFSQDFEEVYKAVATDRAVDDNFGNSVSLSGNYAVIGASLEDEDTTGGNLQNAAGSAYIFERNYDGIWEQVQKITASDRIRDDWFGCSVGISGNYILVGALYESEDTAGNNSLSWAGSAYIFTRDGFGNWTEIQKIVASDRDTNDQFGCSVSISSGYAVIGAGNDDKDAGSAYVFEQNSDGTWREVQKLCASDRESGDRFGYAVDISNRYIVIGAWHESEDAEGGNTLFSAGSAYIYERNNEGSWNEIQKIVASDRDEGNWFGKAVSVSGNYIVVGSVLDSKDTDGGNIMTGAGSAYIFKCNPEGNWYEVQKIVPDDREENDKFGKSVSISGDIILISSLQEDHDESGENMMNDAGSAYIFKQGQDENWSQVQKIVASDRGEEDYFGNDLGISNDYIVIGSYREDEDAAGENTLSGAGSVYIFESCNPGTANDPDNILENGDFEDCMLSPWSVYNADYLGVTADAVLTDGKCTVTNISISDDPVIFQVQLQQVLTGSQVDRLEVGATYELSFEAYAPTARQCRVSFEQAVDPWNGIFNTTIELGTAPADYSYEFTLDNMYENMQLVFQLGNENTPATLDNVRLVKKPVVAVQDKSMEDLMRIMPNPADDFIQVQAANGSRVSLYNNLGTLVDKAIITDTQIQLDISGYPKGVYIIEVKTGKRVGIDKLIVE